MKIGLVDIDGHAKKKKWGATIYPNLALAKIARYHRERGDQVEWAIPFCHYDRINYWWEKTMAARKSHQGRYVYPHAQPFRDPDNPDQVIPQWQKDLAAWVNKRAHFVAHSFADFKPRKGFTCRQYLQTLY